MPILLPGSSSEVVTSALRLQVVLVFVLAVGERPADSQNRQWARGYSKLCCRGLTNRE